MGLRALVRHGLKALWYIAFSGVGSKTVAYFVSLCVLRVLARCWHHMAGVLNECRLTALNDVTDLLPHAGLECGTWDVISSSLGGVPNVVVFAFMRKETLDVAVAAARITPTGRSDARAL